MQQKKTKPKQPKIIEKPILTGSWNGPEAWKLVPKRMLSIVLIGVLYLFCSVMAGFENPVLKVIVSLAIIGVAIYYQAIKGMEIGEKDAAFSEIMYERQQEGKDVSKQDLQRCFHPFRGAFATLMAAIPFMIICLVYAFVTKPWEYQLGVLPSWMDNLLMHNEMGDALAYYNVTRTLGAVDVLRIIVRCLIMPFVNIASVSGNNAILWVERFSALLMLIAPMGFGVGYARGHDLRTRINTGIQQGVAQKKRKERKARKRRQNSSSPERLI